MQETPSSASSFQGKRKAAVARLRRLTALACEYLPAETINVMNFHLAVYLQVKAGQPDLAAEMSEELACEQATMDHSRPELTPADRKLLRQLGIEN